MNQNYHNQESNTQNPWVMILIIILVMAVFFTGSVIYFRYFLKGNSFGNIFSNNNQIKTQVVSKLDGTTVDEDLAKRHPLAVMVENHPDARPQSGLSKASIVYEAITEGGITRFMAIFGPADAPKIGPIRSARTYFIDWLSEYNAYYAHVGGNLDALDQIKTDNILDLDQFSLGEPTYYRIADATKAIEHTMYSNTTNLYQAAKTKSYPQASNFQALNFRQPAPNPDSIQTITINFSTSSYLVRWDYDAKTNTYLRTLAGSPHRDELSGPQLAASNLIIQEVERWSAPTTINEEGFAMKTIGTGNALVFIDGKQIKATWKKTGLTDRTLFFDENGSEIKFIPGQFWYEIAPPEVFQQITIK